MEVEYELLTYYNSGDYNQICPRRAGLVAEILPSVYPHSARLFVQAGICWQESQSAHLSPGSRGHGYK